MTSISCFNAHLIDKLITLFQIFGELSVTFDAALVFSAFEAVILHDGADLCFELPANMRSTRSDLI